MRAGEFCFEMRAASGVAWCGKHGEAHGRSNMDELQERSFSERMGLLYGHLERQRYVFHKIRLVDTSTILYR